MQKTIEVVYEKGVFKPLEKVELEEGEKVVIRKIETSLREYNNFLPRDFNFTREKLRIDSIDRFRRLGVIP